MAGPEEPAVGPPNAVLNPVMAHARLPRALRTAVASAPTYELKRVGMDLEFALERNAKGVASIVVFGGDRRIEPKNVHKLRLKMSAKGK